MSITITLRWFYEEVWLADCGITVDWESCAEFPEFELPKLIALGDDDVDDDDDADEDTWDNPSVVMVTLLSFAELLGMVDDIGELRLAVIISLVERIPESLTATA